MLYRKSTILTICFLLFLLFNSCQRKAVQHNTTDDVITKKAKELSQRFLIIDGHVDLPYRLRVKNFQLTREYMGIPVESDEGDFDYVRSKQGGLDAPFMSIYIPASYQTDGGAKELADTLINMVDGIIKAHPDKFAAGKSTAQVRANFKKGLVSLPMGMENGAPIGEDLTNVAYFHKRGIRYVTLTHSKDNQICDSSYDTTSTWNGLSPFGEKVITEMNRVGIMVDISHVSDSTFYQVIKLSKAPIIASHSSCRKFTPGFERNMNDDMIKRLGKNGGVMMINFGSTFLDGDIQKYWNEQREKLNQLLATNNLSASDEAAKPIIEQFRKDNPILYADVKIVADHIDHVVKLAGVDHVGFGSDYDGVGDSLPTGLKDVSQYPNLISELLKRGYSEADIEKICSGNLLRVWEQVEKIAAL